VAQAHLRYLNPLPANTREVLGRYDRVLIPEMNLGQLRKLLRAEFLVDAVGYNRVTGMPFKGEELVEAIEPHLSELGDGEYDGASLTALTEGANHR
jgi:2-oxoglutarate ferredoxin oxidoreductase subunit alpha